eukprot:2581554-Rhodomonas_salina.1
MATTARSRHLKALPRVVAEIRHNIATPSPSTLTRMVRPFGSERNKHFASAFASLMSVHDARRFRTLARSGSTSVYELLVACYPAVTRVHAKNGVSLCEVNKALEKAGFERQRFRHR